MQKPKNPFFIKNNIPDAYFCDRETETKTLIRLLTNGNDVLLISPRRMGKSGLINHCFESKQIRKEYYTFFIDIFETSSLKEFTYKLGKEVFDRLSFRDKGTAKTFIQSLLSLRHEITFDAAGNPSYIVSMGQVKNPELTLDEIFDYIEKASMPCLVAIDEFQKIADYEEKNIEAVLRTRIQRMGNANFIFSGSERDTLYQMFSTRSRPFYQSTSPLSLEAIDKEVYTKFALSKFREYGKTLEKEAARDVYILFDGCTSFLQKTMNEAFSLTREGDVCTRQDTFSYIQGILDSNEITYKSQLVNLTANQRELVYAIAMDGSAAEITSQEFNARHHLSSVSSTQAAARSLLKKQLVSKTENRYSLSDKFMELWICQAFGKGLEQKFTEAKARKTFER